MRITRFGTENQPGFFIDVVFVMSAASQGLTTSSLAQRGLVGEKSPDIPATRATSVQPPLSLHADVIISQCA